jgi:hypothetical protein
MNGSWLSRLLRAALVAAFAPASAYSDADWRDLRIDGSNLSKLEASVATLQNELPPQRREEFEIALAVIWTRNTLDSDLDEDGDVDLDDGLSMKESTAAFLADIQSGNLYAAIEERTENARQYTADDYLEELDGLAYDEVLRLVGEPSVDPPVTELRPRGGACRDRRARGSECEVQIITVPVAKTLDGAFRALSAGDPTGARARIDELSLDALNAYERSKVEQALFSIAYGEEEYGEAREHAQSAIEAGGLNEQEVAETLGWIRHIDSQLAAVPLPDVAEPRAPTGGP